MEIKTLEDVEENYKKEVEKSDQEFLNNPKKTSKERKELEIAYREKLRQSRNQYQEMYQKQLEKLKGQIGEEKPKKPTEEKEDEEKKETKKKGVPTEISWKEKSNLKMDLFKFRTRIKMKNFSRKLTPNFMLILYLKLKINLKNGFLRFSKTMKNAGSVIKGAFISLGQKMKNLVIKFFSAIKKGLVLLFKKTFGRLKSKKEKEKPKSENQKILDKMLNEEKK